MKIVRNHKKVHPRVCDCGARFLATGIQMLAPKCYCSRECFYKFRIRPTGLKYVIVNPNAYHFKKGQKAMGTPFQKGHLPANFKGEEVGYDALHDWVNRKKGKAEICEECGSTSWIGWANKSHEYQRDLADWIALCVPCHRRHDKDAIGAVERKWPEFRASRREYGRQYRARKKKDTQCAAR